jgi:hypothetical protein
LAVSDKNGLRPLFIKYSALSPDAQGLTHSKGRDVRPLALKEKAPCFEAQGIGAGITHKSAWRIYV